MLVAPRQLSTKPLRARPIGLQDEKAGIEIGTSPVKADLMEKHAVRAARQGSSGTGSRLPSYHAQHNIHTIY